MSNVNKELLIAELNEAVIEANRQDQRAVGVAFFGSRVRPDWHPYAARPDSDVDLIPVCAQNDIKVGLNLKQVVCHRLEPYGLRVHVPEISEQIPIIATSSIDKALSGEINHQELLRLQVICCLFDEYSVVISTDVEQGRRVKRFADTVDYKLVLMNIFSTQKKYERSELSKWPSIK